MHSFIDGPNSYQVEVSGWNVKGIFFVEKAMLHWTETEEKSVELTSRLDQGCVVFVRLMNTTTGSANFPVAYRVLSIASVNSDGRGCVGLMQLRPNIEDRCGTINATGRASKSTDGQKVFSN
jgi:hypothetical protein